MGKVTLKEIRILLDSLPYTPLLLALKVCANQRIHHFHNVHRNTACQRWDHQQDISLDVHPSAPIEIELYDPKAEPLDRVLGQTLIDLTKLPSPPHHQLKLCLSFDGLVVGWLYCQILVGKVLPCQSQQYIHIHKLGLSFLENRHECSLSVCLNGLPIFEKECRLNSNTRTLYPNLKYPVKKSDLLTFQVLSSTRPINPISLLIDHLKCGQIVFQTLWLKGVSKKKQGELLIEYFLDNIYLKNEEKAFTRKYWERAPGKETAVEQPRSPQSFESIGEIKMSKEELKRSKRLKKTILGRRQFISAGKGLNRSDQQDGLQ